MSEPDRDRRWIRIQAASGLTFSLFLVLHLATTMSASGGEETYNAFQGGARAFYQTPLFEIIVVAIPLLTHLMASIVRIVRRRRAGQSRKPPLRLRLHRFSGWFLLTVIGGHVGATRIFPLATETQVRFGDLNFTTVLFGVSFSLYYALLGICGTYHMANGMTIAASVFGIRPPKAIRTGPGFWVPVGAALVAIVLGVASFSGWIFEVGPETWGDSSKLVAELYGSDVETIAGDSRRPRLPSSGATHP